ncbi:MAG: SLC13 family permease [Alphaproteobacteria bacterium]|nr:SLC13 family permease [Alphaproteobacteria bacterium]
MAELDPSTWQMWVVFATILAAIVAFSLERFPIETVAVVLVAFLLVLFDVFPVAGPDGGNRLDATALLAGFANPALVSIMALLVVGQALYQTGAFNGPTERLAELAQKRPKIALALSFAVVTLISAFINNTPVVVMVLPVFIALSATMRVSPSRLLMPLSFVCILGGMTTLIGSSTNLLVAEAAREANGTAMGFFEFSVPAAMLAALGLVYVLFLMPRFLPDRAPLGGTVANESGKQFLVQIVLPPDHRLVGETAVAGKFEALPDMTVRVVERGEKRYLPPFDGLSFEPGDIVVAAAPRKAITQLLTSDAQLLPGMVSHQGKPAEELPADPREGGLIVTEAVVAPGSRVIGYSTEILRFTASAPLAVIGIQRRSRMLRARLSEVRLEAGDVLLLLGTREDIAALRDARDLIALEWSGAELPNVRAAKRARVIFAGVILAAATGLLPIVVASVLGGGLMIAAGCLNVRQAVRAANPRIFLLVGSALALGTSLEATGGAAFAAHALVRTFAPLGPEALISALFLLVALMTNVLTNNATAILFTPIAIGAAASLGLEPRPFIHAVIFAANCSFATPVGYQTNLLVMAPGHYQFRDFLTAGGPLVILIWLAFSFLAPWYYGL